MTSILAQQTEEIRPVTIAGEDGLTAGQAIKLIRRILENPQEGDVVEAINTVLDGTK
jgi:hypothetical protein